MLRLVRDDVDFHRGVLNIHPATEIDRIITHLRGSVLRRLGRRGAVVGLSGGLDSSVVLALCVRSFGPQRVTPVLLQEKESSPENVVLARKIAQHYGVTPIAEDITPVLEGYGCYRRRDEAIRRVFPEYDSTYTCKLSLPGDLLTSGTLNLFSLTIVSPEGVEQKKRLSLDEYRQIVAATNLKFRARMSMLYLYAETRTFAVVGTANKNKQEQGYFVKYGDGGVDVQAIAHLYKTQVYQLAEYLGVPQEILERHPTSDTFSAPSTEEEAFFRLPFDIIDLLSFARERGISEDVAARVMDLTPEQVARVYRELEHKHRATEYLRTPTLDLCPPALV